mgnify:CR=1 FL=1
MWIAKFNGLEPRRLEDIKGIVAPEMGPKIFGTFENHFTLLNQQYEGLFLDVFSAQIQRKCQ